MFNIFITNQHLSIQYEYNCAKIFLVAYFNSDIVAVGIDDVDWLTRLKSCAN